MAKLWFALAPALPFMAMLWIGIGVLFGFNRGENGERQTAFFARLLSFAAFVIIATATVYSFRGEFPDKLVISNWLHSGDINIVISLQSDIVSLSLATLVALICFLTIQFSVNYMHREPGFQRFFMVMSLFNSAMLLIILGGNVAMTFIGWELAGVSSYLLISYMYDRTTASENASRAFITNRIGDVGFLLGIFLCFLFLGDLEWSTLANKASSLSVLNASLIAASFMLAALAKSAAVPFTPWITRALEGPTPSSAVFYGSLMVHAGVFLIIRLEPVLMQSPPMLLLLGLIGITTALYGFLSGLVQTDIKSALIFSVIAHIGLMLLACSLGLFDLASWYLAAHASWRAFQFLVAPAALLLLERRARKVPAILQQSSWLHTAALKRFWLDNITDGMFVRSTEYMAREFENFDDKIVTPLIGLPNQTSAVSSLAKWEQHKQGRLDNAQQFIGQGQGLLGKLMERIATLMHWFEERLVLRTGGAELFKVVQGIGTYLQKTEQLLSKPRYLWLLILATFVIII